MSNSTETSTPGSPSPGETNAGAGQSGVDLSRHIAVMAQKSNSQTDFLQTLAEDLSNQFSAEIVSIIHPEWETPMMLVKRQQTAQRLDGRFVSDLLLSSTASPTACDIPLLHESSSDQEKTRGLHVQLLEDSEPSSASGASAVLVVYGPDSVPDTLSQIQDLKRLGHYASLSRNAMVDLVPKSSSPATQDSASADDHSAGYHRSLRDFHRNLDLSGTALRIANESRRLLAADRVTVLLARRNRFKVEAVSGVAVVDRRANSVKVAEAFAEKVVVLGRPLSLPGEEPLPPQIQEPLDVYLDETDVAEVEVLPLYHLADSDEQSDEVSVTGQLHTNDQSADQDPFAVLLIESFSGEGNRAITPAMHVVSDEATLALANSLEHQRIFGLRFLKTMGDLFGGRNLPYTFVATLAAASLLIASLVIEIDHKIIASGVAEPAGQQNVFARIDGIVKEILVADGQTVDAGDPLLRLENADLESTAESLSGEIQTTTKRLDSVRALLLDPGTDPKQSGRMIIEQRQLESELENHQAQLSLVREQQDELLIRAPIAGVIAGWQLERKLADRPVSRGNHLMTVVDREGPWQLRLEVPDEDTAEVIENFQREGALDIEFAAASNPRSTYEAKLKSISTAARKTPAGANVMDAIAPISIDREMLRELSADAFGGKDARSGVETTAKISCGRRTVLSSWFGDVADFFNRNVMFYIR